MVIRANNFGLGPHLLTNSGHQGRFPPNGLDLGGIWDQLVCKSTVGQTKTYKSKALETGGSQPANIR